MYIHRYGIIVSTAYLRFWLDNILNIIMNVCGGQKKHIIKKHFGIARCMRAM